MTRRFFRIIALAWAAFTLPALAGCAGLQDAPAQAAAPPPGPALWKVADEDTTIYLFGTIHALPKNVEWYQPHIAQALESSDELVTEVDTADVQELTGLLLQKAILPKGENLRDKLGEDERKAYEEAMVSIGLPVQTFDRFKPWYAAMNFSLIPLLNAGYDTDSGVESVLDKKLGPDKKHDHLETAEFQLGLFDSLPPETQLTYLKEVITAVPQLTGQLNTMVDEWLRGDAEALAREMNAQETDPIVYQRLITDRNASWAGWIKERMERPGTVFIAVGAGHLAGKGSVLEQLRKLHLKSARVR